MTLSKDHSPIPVKNIYFMLAYAWNHPHEKDFISVYDKDEKDLMNLLCKVLLMKVKALIKKGFYKEYVHSQDEAAIIRGKILFKESMERFSYKKGRMHFIEEDMSHDILHNQLIKATLYLLSRSDNIERQYRDEVHSILPYFNEISLIKVSNRLFNEVNLHRNNQHYKFIINICQFVWENTLIHEGESDKQFQDFSREHQQMARLFENFVKNFYRREIPGAKVKSETFIWPAEGEDKDFLPNMKTDISLVLPDKKVIMDTKFYKDAFMEQWEKESIRSGHLYQLFSYLINDEYRTGKKANGILLYPKVQKNINLNYKIHGFNVKICTVDMAQHWEKIHERLLEII